MSWGQNGHYWALEKGRSVDGLFEQQGSTLGLRVPADSGASGLGAGDIEDCFPEQSRGLSLLDEADMPHGRIIVVFRPPWGAGDIEHCFAGQGRGLALGDALDWPRGQISAVVGTPCRCRSDRGTPRGCS